MATPTGHLPPPGPPRLPGLFLLRVQHLPPPPRGTRSQPAAPWGPRRRALSTCHDLRPRVPCVHIVVPCVHSVSCVVLVAVWSPLCGGAHLIAFNSTCGVDPGRCGIDPARGVDPGRGGVDPARGVDPSCGGIDPARGIDPGRGGIDPACGVDPTPLGLTQTLVDPTRPESTPPAGANPRPHGSTPCPRACKVAGQNYRYHSVQLGTHPVYCS